MKKKISLLLVLLMLVSIMPTAFADEAKVMDAVKSTQKITLDNEPVEIAAYNIAGNNYLKLRDIAAIMIGKKCGFNVDYDAKKNMVIVESAKPYTKLDTDLKLITMDKAKAVVSEKEILLNGDDKDIDTAYINQNNYVKLRDIAKIVGFFVGYDEATATVIMRSDAPYIEEEDKDDDDNDEIKDMQDMSIYDLYDFDSERENVLDEIKEHEYTFINLWAAWCKPCVEEIPTIAKLAKEYDDVEDKDGHDRLGFMGIVMSVAPYHEGIIEKEAMERKADLDKAQALLKSANADYDNYTLSVAAKKHFDETITAYPTTLIVDRSGKIVETIVGSRSYEQFKEIISKYIK